jgi:hypothetical protein
MRHIFEGHWLYLAHGSQIADKNDYYDGRSDNRSHRQQPRRQNPHQLALPVRRGMGEGGGH